MPDRKWNAETRKWEFAADELEKQVEATLASERIKAPDAVASPTATEIRYLPSERRFRLDLSNGTTYLFPADLCQGLTGATSDDLTDVRIRPGGDALHWPRLNEDYSVMALVMGIFGGERWTRQIRQEIGRQAGLSRSEAKKQAARLNGKKGGRPRSNYRFTRAGDGYDVSFEGLHLGRIERVGSAHHPRWRLSEVGGQTYPTREEAAEALHRGNAGQRHNLAR